MQEEDLSHEALLVEFKRLKSLLTSQEQNDEKYRLLFEYAGDAILTLNENTFITDVNASACRLFGYSQEELLGMNITELVPARELENQAMYLESVKQNKGLLAYRTFVRKDGSEVETEINNRLIAGAGFIAIIRDITERKKAQLALEESEEKYHSLIEHAGDAIFLLGIDTSFVHVNSHLCNLVGYTREELLGMKLSDLYPFHELQRRTLSIEYLRVNKKLLIERKWRRKDGTEVDVEINTRVIEGKGYLNIARDISERKKAEEKLQKSEQRLSYAMSATSDALWEWDYVNGTIFYSPRWYEMLGYEEQTFEMSLAAWKRLCHPDDIKNALAQVRNILHDPKSRGYHAEFRILHKDGTWVWILSRGNVVKRDSRLNPVMLSGTNSDITERKKVEAELKKTVSELNDRHNEMMQFSYIVSHNLRAPVATMLGLANLMNMPKLDMEEKLKIMEQVMISVGKMDDLLKDLNIILYSQSALNKNKEKINIEQVINSILDILNQQIIEAKAEIITQISDDSQEVYTIKAYMESILYNLINNAIKFKSSQRPLQLKITSERTMDQLFIMVADNGIGIDLVAHGKNIFGLYKRFHLASEGKGLGLHMTKIQVEALGGKIKVESEIGLGTTFTITLPIGLD